MNIERILFIDSDAIIIQSIDRLFQLKAELIAAMDKPCTATDHYNSGVVSLRPSRYLLNEFLSFISRPEEIPCISNTIYEGDQEIINCICGTGGAVFPRRPAITCGTLPWYMNVLPNQLCPRFITQSSDMTIIHFAGHFKPQTDWKLMKECLAADILNGFISKPTEWFQDDIRRRCYEGNNGLFSYYHCMDDRRSIDQPQPQCQLVVY